MRKKKTKSTFCYLDINREPQQYSTDYLYKVSMIHATTVCPTLMSMFSPHVHW